MLRTTQSQNIRKEVGLDLEVREENVYAPQLGDRVRYDQLTDRGREFTETGIINSVWTSGERIYVCIDGRNDLVRDWSPRDVTYVETATTEELLTHWHPSLQYLGKFQYNTRKWEAAHG